MRNFPRLLLLSIFGAFLLTSCQEDEKPIDNSAQVIGYWKSSIAAGENMQMVQYLTFLENGKFNAAIVYLDADTDEPLGYSGRSSGDYTLLDDQLATQTTTVYGVPESSDTLYVPNESLVFVEENFSNEIKVEFTDDKMTVIYPGCGPLELCIGSQVFERYTPLEF